MTNEIFVLRARNFLPAEWWGGLVCRKEAAPRCATCVGGEEAQRSELVRRFSAPTDAAGGHAAEIRNGSADWKSIGEVFRLVLTKMLERRIHCSTAPVQRQ